MFEGSGSTVEAESVQRMSRDLATAMKTMSDEEARFAVDAYYMMQDDRKRASNQFRALGEDAEPNSLLGYLAEQSTTLENQVKRALDKYTEAHPMGKWMREVHGVGPVISAGLLAHIDIMKADTVGHIWRFAGLDPTSKWEKGQKRPFNAALKVLCWKAGQSFMKFSNDDKCYYGKIYRDKKRIEWERNLDGKLSDQVKEVAKSTDAWAWYNGCYDPAEIKPLLDAGMLQPDKLAKIKHEAGRCVKMLPPAHIDARARRYAVKIFLYDLFAAWYRTAGRGTPPKPWIIEHGGHAHLVVPPQGH
jgi:hypothetical protein